MSAEKLLFLVVGKKIKMLYSTEIVEVSVKLFFYNLQQYALSHSRIQIKKNKIPYKNEKNNIFN